ncbi:hypothetical protein GCM10025857_01150 [Alicyclobacillus contaminans]|uniref:uroporphyrinogen-III C-methyltransferase n=1 Tax=Alicyclobacillus contaminans TaxID=392016 RepID=UPI00040FD6F6|nr:uroporphyrinogen-III C-methyltransferase [Alicyclobacillus contaminans]GMA48758.1 hypothetical protein GCM10025857_01150 [Alicyclobacillus contaminans]
MRGRVFLIGAGPGHKGLLTLRAIECLELAEVVLYDRLVSPEVLACIPETAERIDVGKSARHHRMEQTEIIQRLIQHAEAGRTVARLKGGDPFVFGRGSEEAQALAERGIPFEIVPGVSSAIAGPALAGIPLTHRGISTGFHVVTGHECLDSAGTPWPLLAASNLTLVILMGLGRLETIVEQLIRHGRSATTPAAVIQEATTPRQRVVAGTLSDIAERVRAAAIEPPALIVVGQVVAIRDQLGGLVEAVGTPQVTSRMGGDGW